MADINLNLGSGREKIYINKELYGEDRVIYIDTTDDLILPRIRKASRELIAQMKVMQDKEDKLAEMEKNGDDVTDERIDMRERCEKIIRDQIDYIFGYSVSDIVFGTASAMAPYGDTTYVEAFLSAITPVISERLKSAKEKSQNRIKAYTHKYTSR